MNITNIYLTYLTEKLEDITIDKKKWYDILNIEMKKLYQKEIKDVFEKYFIVRHPLIDNKKTQISVSFPLLGHVFFISINLYDKKGNDIIDYEHDGNMMGDPFSLQIQKKGTRWILYYHTLFIKDQYQRQHLGSIILKSADIAMRKLQNSKFAWYQSSDVGKYAWSRIPGVKFKNPSGLYSHHHVEKQYQKWCNEYGKKCKKGQKPQDYPKNYLLSKLAPEFINYLVPIGK